MTIKIINDIVIWLIFGGFLAAFMAFWIKTLKPYLESKIQANKSQLVQAEQQLLLDIAQIVVVSINDKLTTASQSDKVQMAVQRVNAWLKANGLSFSEAQVLSVVEYAFNELTGQQED